MRVSLPIVLAALMLPSCTDRTAEEPLDREEPCAAWCTAYMSNCNPDEKNFSSQDDCVADCVDDEPPWEPCAQERAAWHQCLAELSCEDYRRYSEEGPYGECLERQIDYSGCSMRGGDQ